MLSSGIIVRMEGTEELEFTEEILGVSAPEQDLDKELQDLLKSDHTEEEDTASVCTAEEDKTKVLLASLIADLGKSDKVGKPIQEKVAKLVEGLCSGGWAMLSSKQSWQNTCDPPTLSPFSLQW